MKFSIKEDLESSLKDRYELENETRINLEKLFTDNNFKPNRSINGTSYSAEQDDVKASFYIDDKISYSGYVTTDNFSITVKGELKDAVEAAHKIVDEYNQQIGSLSATMF